MSYDLRRKKAQNKVKELIKEGKFSKEQIAFAIQEETGISKRSWLRYLDDLELNGFAETDKKGKIKWC